MILVNALTVTDADENGPIGSEVVADGAITRLGFAVVLVASGISGTDTPTFPVVVEHSPLGVDAWTTLVAFTNVTANGSENKQVAGPVHERIRISLGDVTGTDPEVTLTVAAS